MHGHPLLADEHDLVFVIVPQDPHVSVHAVGVVQAPHVPQALHPLDVVVDVDAVVDGIMQAPNVLTAGQGDEVQPVSQNRLVFNARDVFRKSVRYQFPSEPHSKFPVTGPAPELDPKS
jgi:hypothetical protein